MPIIRILCVTLFVCILANCGSQVVSTPQATLLPSATIEPTQVAPTSTAVASKLPTLIATNQPTPIVNTDDTLASALTPEGYHVLGDLNAPITFVDYSDYF